MEDVSIKNLSHRDGHGATIQEQPAFPVTNKPAQIRDPLVSICVTAHNYAHFLPDCIESILNQDYRSIECIVVDDGSQDDTRKVLESYAGRLKVIYHASARGQLAAIVSAFEHSRGQFISFVDADDMLYRNYVASHIAAHTSMKTYAALSSSLQEVIDGAGHTLATHPSQVFRPLLRLPKWSFRKKVIHSPPVVRVPLTLYDPQANYAFQWLWGTMSSMMFRRDAVALALKGFPQGFVICADSYLAHFCHAIGGTFMIEMPLSAYRRHGTNNFSNNPVIGGLSPLGRHLSSDPRPLIAEQIRAHREEFFQVLGPRRFVALVEKFLPLGQAIMAIFSRQRALGISSYLLFLALLVTRRVRTMVFRIRRIFAILKLNETP